MIKKRDEKKWEIDMKRMKGEEELDRYTLPYSSDHLEDAFRKSGPWLPLDKGQEVRFIMRNKATGREVFGLVVLGRNKLQTWVQYKGQNVRPRDAVRLMQADLEV
jgi:hypothetical protein